MNADEPHGNDSPDVSETANKTFRAEAGAFSFTMGRARMTLTSPLPDDHAFYGLVGRVASEWAHFEHVLDVLIWTMAGIDQQLAACLTAQIMGPPGKCRAIISIGELRGLSKGLLAEVKTLLGNSYDPADKRARFVHDPWYLKQTDGEPPQTAQFRAMPYSDRRYGHTDIGPEEADAALKAIRALRDQADKLKQRILDELKAST